MQKTLRENETDFVFRGQKSSLSNDRTKQLAKKPKQELQFVGKHLTLEEYRKLSLDERGDFKQRLKEQNHKWLEEKFAKLCAVWLMVLDGEVIAHGNSMRDYPGIEKICEIGQRYGKRPFIFVNDLFVAIEEGILAWHPTIYDDDFYPTVRITLRANSGSIEIKLPSKKALRKGYRYFVYRTGITAPSSASIPIARRLPNVISFWS